MKPWIVGTAGVLIALADALVLAPSAKVVLEVPANALSASAALHGSPNPNELGQLHTTPLTTSDRSLTKTSELQPATGKVRFRYEYVSQGFLPLGCMFAFTNPCGGPNGPDLLVPKGSVLATCIPQPPRCVVNVRFITLESATVSLKGGESGPVPIQAMELGPAGNVARGAITVVVSGPKPAADANLSIDSFATSGGRSVITQVDIDLARSQAMSELQDQLAQAIFDLAKKNNLALAGGIDYPSNWVADHQAGESVQQVNVTVTMKAAALGYSPAELRPFIAEALRRAAPKGRYLIPESVEWDQPGVQNIDRSTGRVTLAVAGHGLMSAVDPSAVQRQSRGEPLEAAADGLKLRYSATHVRITTSPSWLPFMPLLSRRIHVLILPHPAQ
jgi:hypothetical protein